MFHAGFEATALNHEPIDHAVKDGAVVMAFGDVRQKIGGAFGRFLAVQLQGDHAMIGDVQFDFRVAHAHLSKVALRIVTGVLGTF